ncbi:unnamed protein product [Protopolystoma xenopodis]|uniref:Uncharacterized protein n=1 Tax=Protopolystoma xenopodis TaxID=117903 RepID=A0A448WBY6_9PLAT|nr:unnamed protein product [Protopolystoma xenopodis]
MSPKNVSLQYDRRAYTCGIPEEENDEAQATTELPGQRPITRRSGSDEDGVSLLSGASTDDLGLSTDAGSMDALECDAVAEVDTDGDVIEAERSAIAISRSKACSSKTCSPELVCSSDSGYRLDGVGGSENLTVDTLPGSETVSPIHHPLGLLEPDSPKFVPARTRQLDHTSPSHNFISTIVSTTRPVAVVAPPRPPRAITTTTTATAEAATAAAATTPPSSPVSSHRICVISPVSSPSTSESQQTTPPESNKFGMVTSAGAAVGADLKIDSKIPDDPGNMEKAIMLDSLVTGTNIQSIEEDIASADIRKYISGESVIFSSIHINK